MEAVAAAAAGLAAGLAAKAARLRQTALECDDALMHNANPREGAFPTQSTWSQFRSDTAICSLSRSASSLGTSSITIVQPCRPANGCTDDPARDSKDYT